MKIASLTSYWEPDKIGGGYIPAVAFKEWCEILGLSCDLINYKDDPAIIDGYDYVFLSTTDIRISSRDIKCPYAVMIHAEFDDVNYDLINNAKSVVVIDKPLKYWDFKDQIFWHPCTLPKFLLTGNEFFHPFRKGTLYAARISRWKNANTLLAYSNLNMFQEIYGPVKIIGKANDQMFGNAIYNCLYDAIVLNKTFDIHYMETIASLHKYFWDVSGTNTYKIHIKRLNLACFEAMKYGCIPIVNKKAVPEEVHDFCIDFRDIGARHNTEHMQEIMLNKAKTEYFGYEQVKQQVIKILNALGAINENNYF